MRLALISYFDLGASYSLTDAVFGEEASSIPDIGEVGVSNPLGEGLYLELRDASVMDSWRQEALLQSHRTEMELGWHEETGVSKQEFEQTVRSYVSDLPVASCSLTIHAIGTVVVWLEFDGPVALPYSNGLLACFEFAGYRPDISRELLSLGREKAADAADPSASALLEMSAREPAPDQVSASGYIESRMFSFFTRLAICLEDEDATLVPDIVSKICGEAIRIEFEFHGDLHYSDGACVIVGRSVLTQGEQVLPQDRRSVEVQRIVADVRIAHAFLGACDAFSRLFVSEIHHQVNGFVKGSGGGRTAHELNRLRTLALAVVTLTDFNLATPTPEDHQYFRHFGADVQLVRLQTSVQSACEMLYNVQAAETQRDEEHREQILNRAVALLAAFTLVSVSVDAYAYVRDADPLIHARVARLVILLQMVLVLGFVTLVFVRRTMPVAHRRWRNRHSS